ncbi:MAG TPA: patatin-like phospholipase family protein [Bryobacteraceae bacterium]|jgi:NTE family protein
MVWKDVLHSVGRSLNRAGAGGVTRVGLALGGGFARGVAHIGVLRAFEAANIPIYAIAGVSAGSVVASCYASGRTPDEIEEIATSMKFRDVARWTVDWLGVLDSQRMDPFLKKSLKVCRFEDMRIPLAVVASDLHTGAPAIYKHFGDVVGPVRASCSYPGLFKPVELSGRLLVDGMVAMEVPAKPLFDMGATHVVSVYLPADAESVDPLNLVAVVNRCFQLMSARMEVEWRRHSDAVIVPKVDHIGWDSFDHIKQTVAAGEAAAEAIIPHIREWFAAVK